MRYVWAYIQIRVAIWFFRLLGRLIVWGAFVAVLAAAAPVTLVAAVGVAGACCGDGRRPGCGGPGVWALPMTGIYLAGWTLQTRTWKNLALAPVHDWLTAWHAASLGKLTTAFVLCAPVAVPAGLIIAGWLWAWRIYAIHTGLAGKTATASAQPPTATPRSASPTPTPPKPPKAHQNPADHRPGAGPDSAAGLLLARRRQTGHEHDREPAQRRPRPLPLHREPGLDGHQRGRHLGQPKYTGYMVYGRRRATPGYKKGKVVPQDQWLWSPQPTHPAIVSRPLWDAAQQTGHGHPDTQPPGSEQPTFRRAYVLRSRIWCRDCNRRMRGTLTRSPGSAGYIYYDCPHRTTNPRHYAQHPDHPTTVRVREDTLITVIKQFCDQRVFGPDREAMLAQQLPASAADAAERRDQQVTALRKRLRQIDAAERAHAREIEALTSTDDNSPAWKPSAAASSNGSKNSKPNAPTSTPRLPALERQAEQANDPTLLDALPQIIGAFDRIPTRLRTALFQALGLEVVYNKEDHQVSIYATITSATPHALAAIIATSEPPRPAPASTTASRDEAVSHSLRALDPPRCHTHGESRGRREALLPALSHSREWAGLRR